MDTQISNIVKEVTTVGEWKEVVGYLNYLVSAEGEVLNINTGRILSQSVNPKGYRLVSLGKNGKYKQYLVHRLVAKAFIPNPDNKPVVNHKDSNRGNSNRSNLEWVTHKENSEHMVNNFRSPTQTMTILLDKTGNEICVFPSEARCLRYIYKRFRIERGYSEYEPIVGDDWDMELYKELSPVSRDRRPARVLKLNF